MGGKYDSAKQRMIAQRDGGKVKKGRKKSTPNGVVPTDVLPFAVALLLTVEDQIIHISDALVCSHSVLLSLFLILL